MIRKYLLISVFLLVYASPINSLSSETIVIHSIEGKYPIGKYLHYLVDIESKYNIESILKENSQIDYLKSQSETLNFGQNNLPHWIRFTIKNANDTNLEMFLEIDYSNIDQVDFYESNILREFEKQSSGMLFPFYVRKIKNRNFVFNINLNPQEEKTYYIRLITSGGLIVPISLWNKDAFHEFNADMQQGLGVYYGIMLVMFLYNLFIFFSVKDISYFYYVLYILGFSGIQLVLTGHGFQYIWYDYPWAQRNFYVLFSSIAMAAILMFTKRFLNTDETVPKINYGLRILVVLFFLLFFLPFINFTELAVKLSLFLTVPSLMLVFIVSIIAYIKKYRPARYFLLAFSVLQISSVIVILKFLNLLESNFLTEYGLYIGSSMEVVLLSIALADRINIMKKEKEVAQAKTLEMQKILTESYARFVPKDFLSYLGKDSILDVRLGDQIQKDMAVMFSDIRSFTTLSEKMTPAENFNFINSYLSRMSPIIQRNNGFIDKYIGDAIMALFEKSVLDAVSAGVEMQKYLVEYNDYRKKKGYDPIKIGIGINSGTLMLGTIGAESRLEGTVISDTVNLTSRIESLTKLYGSKIAVSENTILQVKKEGKFNFRFLDRVNVRGKEKPISIYEILDGDESTELELKLKTYNDYETATRYFHEKNFEDSKQYFNKVLSVNPNDMVVQFYLKRLFPLIHNSATQGI